MLTILDDVISHMSLIILGLYFVLILTHQVNTQKMKRDNTSFISGALTKSLLTLVFWIIKNVVGLFINKFNMRCS